MVKPAKKPRPKKPKHPVQVELVAFRAPEGTRAALDALAVNEGSDASTVARRLILEGIQRARRAAMGYGVTIP